MERALALVAVDAGFLGDVVVVGDDHPALAAGDDLRGVEGEARGPTERAGRAAVVGAAVRVRGVLDELARRPPRTCCAISSMAGRDEPADVHDHDRRGVGTDARREVGGIDRHRLRVAVDEAQPRAGVHRGGRGREERVGGHDDLASLDADGAQDDLERGGSGADRDRVPRAVTRRERVLELAPDRAERELPGGERVVDACEDRDPVFGRKQDSSRGHAHGQRI